MTFAGPLVLTNPHALPDVRRGSETLIQSLGSWLRPRVGGGVTVMAGGPPGTYEIDGLRYRRVIAPDLRRIQGELDAEVTLIPGLAARIRLARPALVHSFLYPDAAAARLAGVPYIVSYGGIADAEKFRRWPLRWQLFHLASRRARRVFCPSRAAADHMRKVYGYQAEVLPNGLNVADFWQQSVERDGNLLLCASTPDDGRKRVEVLFGAFDRLAATMPDLHLVVAGSARSDTRSRLTELLGTGAKGRVRFLGELDPVSLRDWYSRAALTCLPSVNEAFGMVIVESLAAGTPVVGANHGAIPEIVTPQVGALFEADDPASCAAAISSVLVWGNGVMVEECRKQAAKFDWQTVGPQYLAAYEEAL